MLGLPRIVSTQWKHTPNHHKNHYRNYYLLKQSGPGSADITIGFFGFRPCANGGLGITWLATVCQPQGVAVYSENYNRRTLQHEISHLFGCHDFKPQTHLCTDGQLCIMRGSFDNIVSMDQSNIWCDLCASEFDRDAH